MTTQFTLEQRSFVRKHWQIDMSSLQLATYFGCGTEDIDRLTASMKLKLGRNNWRMTAFHTPYPPQIAKSVKKFNWATYSGENNGKEEVHTADPD